MYFEIFGRGAGISVMITETSTLLGHASYPPIPVWTEKTVTHTGSWKSVYCMGFGSKCRGSSKSSVPHTL